MQRDYRITIEETEPRKESHNVGIYRCETQDEAILYMMRYADIRFAVNRTVNRITFTMHYKGKHLIGTAVYDRNVYDMGRLRPGCTIKGAH